MDGDGYNIERRTREIDIIHNEKDRGEKRMIELKNVSKAYDAIMSVMREIRTGGVNDKELSRADA